MNMIIIAIGLMACALTVYYVVILMKGDQQ